MERASALRGGQKQIPFGKEQTEGSTSGRDGEKGTGCLGGWASSGFLDSGRLKSEPPYAQNDGLWDLGLRWEAFGPEGRTRADSLREGQNRRKHKRKRWGERDGLFGGVASSGFFDSGRLKSEPPCAQNDELWVLGLLCGRAFGPEGKYKSRFPSGMTKSESEGQKGRVKGKGGEAKRNTGGPSLRSG